MQLSLLLSCVALSAIDRDTVSQLFGRLWLRWYDAAGNWIPTPAEQVEQERQRGAELEAILARYREKFGELSE